MPRKLEAEVVVEEHHQEAAEMHSKWYARQQHRRILLLDCSIEHTVAPAIP